jgi:hypothetical protein
MNGLWTTTYLETKKTNPKRAKKQSSSATFRSWVLEVMSLARFHCATELSGGS